MILDQRQLELTLGVDWKTVVFPVGRKIFRGVTCLENILGQEWRLQIDSRNLDMENNHQCVLAQLFGDYDTGCRKLGLEPFSKEPSSYGFNVVVNPHRIDGRREFEALRLGWIVVVERNLPTDCLPQLKIAV